MIYLQRKAASEKQALPRSRTSQKMTGVMDYELDDSLQNPDLQAQRPKRPKRPTKSVNETLEPASTGTLTGFSEQTHYPSMSELGSGIFRPEAGQDISKRGDSFA